MERFESGMRLQPELRGVRGVAVELELVSKLHLTTTHHMTARQSGGGYELNKNDWIYLR